VFYRVNCKRQINVTDNSFHSGKRKKGRRHTAPSKLNSAFLKEARIILGEDMDIPLGASVGAIFLNGNGTVYSEALKKADKALYNVKTQCQARLQHLRRG
jgi:GGDEF domain-containing protein